MRIAMRLSKDDNDKLWRIAFKNDCRNSSGYVRTVIDKDIKRPLKKLPPIKVEGSLDHNTSIVIDENHMEHLKKQRETFGLTFAVEYLRILIKKDLGRTPI
jgi:hypothetical protein